jgi:hypothetical protein
MHTVKAQRPETGIWFATNLHVNFSKHWQWHNDAGHRTFGISAQPIQYLYRTGVRYHFNKQGSTAGGVAFFFTKTDFDKSQHEFGREFRFWEELNQQQDLNENWQWLFRFRADQRFFATNSLRDAYTAYRFRLRTGFSRKLNDKWSLQLTDEYMMQLAHEEFSFDQNRVNLFAFYRFSNSSQLQGGYIWLKWPNGHQHIFSFTYTKIFSMHEN